MAQGDMAGDIADTAALVAPAAEADPDVYSRVREMAVAFRFAPGQRINEGDLARQLSVSRTPVREAMQKLVSDNLLVWRRKQGFFCRALDPKEIADLFELRCSLEVLSVRLACRRASGEDLDGLEQTLGEEGAFEGAEESVLRKQLIFHERLATLSGNGEIERSLKNINARIYFVRWIAMEGRWERSNREHREIVEAIRARDEDRGAAIMVTHLDKRPEEISALVREGYARIYSGEYPPKVEGLEI